LEHSFGTAEDSRSGVGSFSAEIQAAVRAELETMLKAPVFSQSGRCKGFLGHVVSQTLSGKASQLKERTIGVCVFERPSDYDTGDDSIVRVTANEVRKRISQFYRESSAMHMIQIELPRGSYVPEFRLQATTPEKAISPVEPVDSISRMVETQIPEPHGVPKDQVLHRKGRHVGYLTLLAGCVILCGVAFGVWRSNASPKVPDLWRSFTNARVPILICIDTHDLHISAPPTSMESQTFLGLVLHKKIIALDDAAVLASMASVLGKKGVSFRVAGAEDISLSDFRQQPVVLIGAIDNKWTTLLTRELPYRIEVENPPGSGSGKAPVASIVDARQPAGMRWTTDLSIPYAAWKTDYAIVARMDDSTTGVPVLIEAGLGNDGSVAASELITSNAMASRLSGEPRCYGKSNFEAVLATDLIDTRPGPPRIVRMNCW
jgi:hypothetical protein